MPPCVWGGCRVYTTFTINKHYCSRSGYREQLRIEFWLAGLRTLIDKVDEKVDIHLELSLIHIS